MSTVKRVAEPRFSRFDVTVAVTVVALIIAVVALQVLNDPANQPLRVAYLYPQDINEPVQNVWIAPIDDPAQAQALTDEPMGIYDFDVSDNGRYLAYSMRDEEKRLLDLHMLDLQTGRTERLTNCAAEDADCFTPNFHPDSTMLSFMKQSLNRELARVRPGVPRIWILDITQRPYTQRPLSQNSQLIGHSPIWSDDGRKLAFFSSDLTNPGILVNTFATQDRNEAELVFVPSTHGTVGTLSPNGRQLIYPEIVDRGGAFFSFLRIADLTGETPEYRDFTDSQAPVDDLAADWHPSGDVVTIERKYLDDRSTRGYQLYNVDLESGAVEPLLFDERYSHHFFEWNATGAYLVVQRLQLLRDDGSTYTTARPEVWVLDTANNEIIQISDRAGQPRWVER